MAKVSVIVPNYNHQAFLEKRIASILEQSYQDFELILLDDCSSDNSTEILSKYANHPKVTQLEVNASNSGSTFLQWQKGVNYAQGEYIWLAESDDFADPTFLANLVESLALNPKAIMAYSQSYEVDVQDNIIGSYYRHTEDLDANLWADNFCYAGDEFVLRFLSQRNCIPNVSAILFRREAFSLLDENVCSCRYLGDWLFYIKLLKAKDIAFVAQPLNYFRTHINTTRSGKSIDDWRITKNEFAKVYLAVYQHFALPKRQYEQLTNSTATMVDNIIAIIPTLNAICRKGQTTEIAIYASGALGVFALKMINESFAKHKLVVHCFIDKKAEEKQYLIEGTPVLSLQQFIDDNINIPIFIASISYYQDILLQLVKKNQQHLVISPYQGYP